MHCVLRSVLTSVVVVVVVVVVAFLTNVSRNKFYVYLTPLHMMICSYHIF